MAQLPLPANIVDQLLDKLSTDDAFRTLFESDPEAALTKLGYTPPPGSCDCMRSSKLADKKTIAATGAAMREQLILGTLSQIPNKLNVGPSRQA